LDLEGEDLNALHGARETLRASRPIVAFEYHPDLWARAGRSLVDADRLFSHANGYRLSPLAKSGDVFMVMAIPL
jgi:hypothetical protein